jgi:hypothetical protein
MRLQLAVQLPAAPGGGVFRADRGEQSAIRRAASAGQVRQETPEKRPTASSVKLQRRARGIGAPTMQERRIRAATGPTRPPLNGGTYDRAQRDAGPGAWLVGSANTGALRRAATLLRHRRGRPSLVPPVSPRRIAVVRPAFADLSALYTSSTGGIVHRRIGPKRFGERLVDPPSAEDRVVDRARHFRFPSSLYSGRTISLAPP